MSLSKECGYALFYTWLELFSCSLPTLRSTTSSNTSNIISFLPSDLRRGLISDGMSTYTRNPNYLGEIMLYGAFILLVNDTISYCAVMFVWFTLFSLRMWAKERSFQKKEGWHEYKERSWILLPKINGRAVDSFVIYGFSALIFYQMYQAGGIRRSLDNISSTLGFK